MACQKPSKPYRRQLCASCYGKQKWAKHGAKINERRRMKHRDATPEEAALRAQRQHDNYIKHRPQRIEKATQYAVEHKDEVQKRNKEWSSANREHLRAYHRAYRMSDAPGAIRMRAMQAAYVVKWRKSHPEAADKHRARQAARRAKGAHTEIVTMAQALFDALDMCHLCGHQIASASEAELDHVVPLACGGLHIRSNIAPAHAVCNRIKRGLHPDKIPPHIGERFRKVAAKHAHFIAPPNWPVV